MKSKADSLENLNKKFINSNQTDQIEREEGEAKRN